MAEFGFNIYVTCIYIYIKYIYIYMMLNLSTYHGYLDVETVFKKYIINNLRWYPQPPQRFIFTSGTKNLWNRRVWEKTRGFASKPGVLKSHVFHHVWISMICHDLSRFVIILFEILSECLKIFEKFKIMPYDALHPGQMLHTFSSSS